MYDYLIRGGTLIDGSGSPGHQADIAITGDRIAAIGSISPDEAEHVIDADGKVVCPGFVDPHTHYDAQLFWDPYATPSSLHGVTSVIAGNCGFTLAPVEPEDADYLRRMMVKVEGMPLAALEQGLPWDWRTFGEYLSRLDGKLGVNVAFLVGHSALRRRVMGEDSVGNEATQEQVDEMCKLLEESIEAGGIGFSTSLAYTHDDGDGQPVPSRFAANSEVVALSRTAGEHEGTTLEIIVDGCMDRFSESELSLLSEMSSEANRPINWNVLTVDSAHRDRVESQVEASAKVAEAGGRLVALTMPILVGMNMSFGFYCALNRLPEWDTILSLPIDERVEKLRDPEVRKFLYEQSQLPEAGVFLRLTNWATYSIGDTYSDENEGLSGRAVGDIARERGGSGEGQNAFDTLCDIVIADGGRTILWPHPTDDDDASWDMRSDLWLENDILIGGSDAGAHLDRMCGAPYTSQWLGDTIRGRKQLSLEQTVNLITDRPARLFGLRHRGRLEEGWFADVVVFDPETIDSGPLRMVDDLPGGTSRLYSEAEGIDIVFCNGEPIVEGGESCGNLPGQVLKSGSHTETVTAR